MQVVFVGLTFIDWTIYCGIFYSILSYSVLVCRKNIIYLHAGANTHVYKRKHNKVLTGSYFSAVLLSFPSRICWLLLCREMLKTDKFPEVSFIFEIQKKKSDVLKNVSWNKLNARTIFLSITWRMLEYLNRRNSNSRAALSDELAPIDQ